MIDKIKITKNIKINLFLCLIFIASLMLSALLSTQTYAVRCDSYSGIGKKACSWCNNQNEHPAANNWGQVCMSAYMWGYEHKSDKRCDTEYSAANEAFRKKWCKDGGVAQYKKENPTTTGGDGDGGGGGSDSASGGGTSSDSEPEILTKGIKIPVADIVAGEINLNDADREKMRLNNKSADNILVGILNVVYTIASVVAVIVIIAAGLIYITSDGDPQKTERARKAIIYASAGLVIIGSAFIITGIIQNIGQAS